MKKGRIITRVSIKKSDSDKELNRVIKVVGLLLGLGIVVGYILY